MAGRAGFGDDQYRVVTELNREWETLRNDSREVQEWGRRQVALAGCDDLDAVLAAVRNDPDGVLGALLWEARAGSTSAARTVLQAMLGKVVLMARAAEPAAGIDAFLVAMWEGIRTYPLERRPHHVAANLALDARKRAVREDALWRTIAVWPPGASFAAVVDQQLARETVDHSSDVAVLTAGDVIKAALELELIDGAAGALLASVYAEGLSSREAAGRHQTSPGMVRRRCSNAVRHLAEHSVEIASYA